VFGLPAIKLFAAIAAPESKRHEEQIFRAIAVPVWPNIDCF